MIANKIIHKVSLTVLDKKKLFEDTTLGSVTLVLINKKDINYKQK